MFIINRQNQQEFVDANLTLSGNRICVQPFDYQEKWMVNSAVSEYKQEIVKASSLFVKPDISIC